MINGFGFCSLHCDSGTPISLPSVDMVSVKNGIFDVMHVADLEMVPPYTELPDGWDLDTIMRADFNGDIGAGNVDYAFYLSTAIRIKRREVNSNTWITLFEVPVSSPEDFNFTLYDKLNRSQTDYEYAVVPVLNSVEGAIVAKQIHSVFDGVCLFDPHQMYSSVQDVSVERNRTQTTAPVRLMKSKYPMFVKQSDANFCMGVCTAFFIPRNSNACGWTTEGGLDYRYALEDMLTNKNAKILKDSKGNIWIIQVDGDINTIGAGHPDYEQTKFNWIEIGDAKSAADLTKFGFITGVGG